MSRNVLVKVMGNSGIVRRLFLSFLGVGLVAGLIFPLLIKSILDIQSSQATAFLIVCIAAGVLVTAANMVIVNVMLLKKLLPIAKMSKAMAAGDIAYRCELKGDDFIGSIGSDMNSMAENMQSTLEEINGATQQVDEASTRLKQVSDETDFCLQSQQSERAGCDCHESDDEYISRSCAKCRAGSRGI